MCCGAKSVLPSLADDAPELVEELLDESQYGRPRSTGERDSSLERPLRSYSSLRRWHLVGRIIAIRTRKWTDESEEFARRYSDSTLRVLNKQDIDLTTHKVRTLDVLDSLADHIVGVARCA